MSPFFSVGALPHFESCALLEMKFPDAKDCRDDMVRPAKIKILAPQKLSRDCLSDVGFPPFLTTNKATHMRFKRALDRLQLISTQNGSNQKRICYDSHGDDIVHCLIL
jgi:hypothetical protein